MTTHLSTNKPQATLKRAPHVTAMPEITQSIVPRSFDLVLGTPDASLESAIRTDGAFQLAVEKFGDARHGWWAAISTGGRIAIDRAAWELTVRYAAGIHAAYAVGIKAIKEANSEKDRETRELRARIDQLTEQRDRAREEALQNAQLPAPIKVELTLPDLNVNVKPSAGISLDYDDQGRVVGTRPRGESWVTKALKGTQAGQSVVP
jgi:hypothetical protein